MAEIIPFRGLRFSEHNFAKPPVAPPYDIISEKERVALAARNHNIINIDKPGSNDDEARYDRAEQVLAAWQAEGALITDDQEALYVYQEEYAVPERNPSVRFVRTGFFAALKLEEFSNGVVLPHEKTLSAPKIDRLKLMKATRANISPIFGLYHDNKGNVKKALDAVVKNKPLYAIYVDDDGTKHTLWKVTDGALIDTLVNALADEKVIIADGHHRYETALTYRDYLLKEKGELNDNANYILMCLVDFSDPGLVVLPTHRLVELKISTNDLIDKLKKYFTVEATTKEALSDMVCQIDQEKVVLGLYTQDKERAYLLALKEKSGFESVMPSGASPLWRRLNVSVLSYCVFKDVLGLSEEQFQKVVTYTHSAKETFDAVDKKAVDFAFLLQGIDKFTIKSISEQGELMPQKSTYFYPKLYTGFVMYAH
ncbi:MAG: DUF1015 domain-containing protein [Candidatus Omnitrophica bacterium]|nr:DUF1015 domain-containing protein [Candidatus Omnitrophota bacterium]